MRRLLLMIACLLPALAGAADRFNLARILVTGSHRYQEEDVVRATGLTMNTQVTPNDLQEAANRLGQRGAFASVQFLFKPARGAKGVEADFQVTDAEKYLPAVFENLSGSVTRICRQPCTRPFRSYKGSCQLPASMSDDVSAALSKFLASKGLPSEISCTMSAIFGGPPTGIQIQGGRRQFESSRRYACGRDPHVDREQLAKAVAPLKGTHYLRSDVAIVLEKNLFAHLPATWIFEVRDN